MWSAGYQDTPINYLGQVEVHKCSAGLSESMKSTEPEEQKHEEEERLEDGVEDPADEGGWSEVEREEGVVVED